MSWLLWVRGLRGLSPQKVFDGVGGQPFINASIKDYVVASHKVKPEEDHLGCDDLASIYPAPKAQKQEQAQ